MTNHKFLLCLVLLPVATAIRQQMQGVSKALEEVSLEDGTTAEEQQPTNGVREAVKTCTAALMQPCTGIPGGAPGYAQAYINSRDNPTENTAERICQETNAQLWTNMNVADVPGLDPNTVLELGEEKKHVVENIGQMRAAKGGNHAMEALMREQLLKCICVHRSANVEVCYQGGQGITEGADLTFADTKQDGITVYTGKLWCQFGFGMPSWRTGGIDTTVLEKHKQYNDGALPEPLDRTLCEGKEGNKPHWVAKVRVERPEATTEWCAHEVNDAESSGNWKRTKSGNISVKRCEDGVFRKSCTKNPDPEDQGSWDSAAELCKAKAMSLEVQPEVKVQAEAPSWTPSEVQETEDDGSNGICDVTLREGRDCSPFTKEEEGKDISNWDWQSRLCKQRIPGAARLSGPEKEAGKGIPNQDACLWQGCLVSQNLTQGALWYMAEGVKVQEAEYCFEEHCGNTEFNLETTTSADADGYCDKKFGTKWRHLKVGPNGLGEPGEQPGSGLWECAHENYHCDWGYCKFFFCDKPELQEQFGQLSWHEVKRKKRAKQ